MKLDLLVQAAEATLLQPSAHSVEISDICYDSRRAKAGDLFAALPGAKDDGCIYARQAAERGAVAILTEKKEPLTHLPQLICSDARLSLAKIARVFFGCADQQMKMGAVTGTNGKSTTAYLTRHILKSAGRRCGMLGTIEYDLGSEIIEAPLTTPESADLHRYLRAMTDAGCDTAMMETSSHSLCQQRVADIDFAVAVFTNLTQDHLDYHRTMEAYRDAKGILFRNLSPRATATLNLDDEAGAHYARLTRAQVLGFSMATTTSNPRHSSAELFARIRHMDIHGVCFDLESPWGKREVTLKLVGAHNAQNCLGAIAAAVSLGVSFDQAVASVTSFSGVPGRLEAVDDPTGKLPFRVLVDYAHTDDALRRVLTALRQLKPSRLIAVFGCGGNRDRGKRPKMARVVEELADMGVITSDNPRLENPQTIIEEICQGIRNEQKFIVSADRARAIDLAIREARSGDVVLIAGKGHENYQICGSEKRHFSDMEQARAAIQRRQEGDNK